MILASSEGAITAVKVAFLLIVSNLVSCFDFSALSLRGFVLIKSQSFLS